MEYISLPKKHRDDTERLIREQSQTIEDKNKIARWILEEGYYPEPYVIPPCFKVTDFKFQKERIDNNVSKSYDLVTISFPKSGLVQRVFGVIHPIRYHDIVREFIDNWDELLNKIFDADNEIYSYSFPIAISKDGQGKLRSGRMIYEFLEMAEKDLVAEAYRYSVLAKVDITNFYNSVYTHTISWAWLGNRYEALKDEAKNELGDKLDKLFQYSNDRRTTGLPVGPVVSDLIVELILSERDKKITQEIKKRGIDFLATRFKDDYKILAHSKSDCEIIIKTIVGVLNDFNLQVNETKTNIVDLPEGLYRLHSQKYEPYSLRDKYPKKVPFKIFETTLLKVLEIHKEHKGTSLIEKFISELFTNDKSAPIHERLKISFVNEKIPDHKDNYEKVKRKNVKKAISLLLMLKKASSKCFAKVLSVIECIILNPDFKWIIDEDYIIDV